MSYRWSVWIALLASVSTAHAQDAGVALVLGIDAGVEQVVQISVRDRKPAGPGEFVLGGTGSKVNAPLREIPATVNIIDQQTLRERGIVDHVQALELLPGVVPQWTYGGFQYNQMRGFQALTLFDGRRDSRMTKGINGSAPMTGLFDVDRIEVLRGPSAVLYGFGAVGGVINTIRKRASRTPQYELEGGLGSPHAWLAHASAQGPILDKLAYRVDLGHVTRRDFRGIQTDRNQVTSTFLYKPTSRDTFNARFSLAIDRYDTDLGLPTIEDPSRPGRWGLPYGARYTSNYGSRQDKLDYVRMEAALDYRHDFSQAVYAELRGWIVNDRYDYLAAEGLNYVPATGTERAQVSREYFSFIRDWRPLQVSAELHADVRTGPLAHKLVGGYQLESFTGDTDYSDQDGATLENVDFAYPVDDSPPVSRNRTRRDHYRVATHSLYAFDHLKLLDALILTGGVRVDIAKSRVRREFVDRASGDEIPEPSSGMVRRPNLESDTQTTGSAGVVYTPLEPLTLYVSYANSYKPNFVQPGERISQNYTPEKSQQLEGGLRMRFDQGGQVFELDAAGYVIRKKNLLVPRGPEDFATAGLAESRGLDLSARYAMRYVQLTGGYSLIDAQFLEYVAPDPVTGENIDLSGKEMWLAPRHSGNVWVRFPFSQYVSAGLGSRMRGRTWADDTNRLLLPSYALLDASITVGNERSSFTLRGSNLLNRIDYFTSSLTGYANPQMTPGPGREILGTLRLTL
ncbi:MAG TPA: TonB-dependent receptor [Polyangiales bacterium]|nr:TonB-dependent receptor [Polyangiales bacterium]